MLRGRRVCSVEKTSSRAPGERKTQACLRPRDRFWDIPVPKIDSAFDNLLVPQTSWSPSTAQQLRKLVAAPYLAPNDWTPRSDAYFASPLALCARRVSSAASRLLGATSLRFALHGWQRENHFSRRVPWHEKWAIGLSWPRPGAQKRRNQGIGERCGLAFFCKISHRVLNRPENRIYSDNGILSCYMWRCVLDLIL
ncbi:hypothetical protein [Thiolapillus sp.]|uniref:hypothetical protein n=1 Tax=Thiolapillus sp. TaxID=2017437 RepID=UPI003AF50DE3